MADEKENIIDSDGQMQGTMDAQTYIDQISKLRQNSVSKEDYEKALADNNMLAQALANGEYTNEPAQSQPTVDVTALRKELYGGDFQGTDLDYVEKTLQLREAIIQQGGKDPFLGIGADVTAADNETAQNLADGLQHCVEFANGDSSMFTAELKRITADSGVPRRK